MVILLRIRPIAHGQRLCIVLVVSQAFDRQLQCMIRITLFQRGSTDGD
jgi:hypothetical protein